MKLQLEEYNVERLFVSTVKYLSRSHQLCVTGIAKAFIEIAETTWASTKMINEKVVQNMTTE